MLKFIQKFATSRSGMAGAWLPIVLLFFAVGFVMNTFCTSPSLLLQNYFSVDQCTFYMVGRSVAHGLVPYVEVADVKGPFVYLLYALGYIISPEKNIGISLLFSLSTTVVLLLAFKTCRVMGLTRGQSVIASMCCLFFLFEPVGQDFGGRTEEFMKPAVAALIYGLVAFGCAMGREDGGMGCAVRRLGWIIGAGAVWVAFIKYNNLVPFVVAGVLAGAVCLWKEGVGALWSFSLRCLYGAMLVALPVLAYLYAVGALDECWNVYVVFNLTTYDNMDMYGCRMERVMTIVSRIVQLPTSIPIVVVCAIMMFFRYFPGKRPVWMVQAVILLTILSLYAVNVTGYLYYYIAVCSPVGILALIPAMRYFPRAYSGKLYLLFIPLTVFSAITYNETWMRKAHMRLTQKTSAQLQQAEDIIAGVPHARILYRTLDFGLGRKAQALPACRYWTRHNGATEELEQDQKRAVQERRADFCIVKKTDAVFSGLLEQHGYEPVMTLEEESYIAGYVRLSSKPAYYVLWRKKPAPPSEPLADAPLPQ